MDSINLIFSFIFGAIVGSFLNVVSLRFNTGMTVGGRSKCMTCGDQLSWKELIPIVSFAVQKGACRNCKSKISWQYPLVEFCSGAVFVLIFIAYPPLTLVLALKTIIYIIATCLLIVIAAYDIKHKIIPDSFVYSFAILSLISIAVGGSAGTTGIAAWLHAPTLGAFIAGPLLALPFALIWLVSKGTWMGLGDAKLVLGIGWLLGVSGGVNAVILAFWIAAVVSLIWIFATYKRFKPKTEVPFGPYLIIGMYMVLLFGIQVIDVPLLRQVIFG